MPRWTFILNAVLTLPFGIAAILAPVEVFAPFGIAIEGLAEGVVRGYGAACLGYGLVMAMARNTTEHRMVFAMLFASLVFNALEVFIQAPLAFSGAAASAIWGTLGGHTLVALLSLYSLATLKRAESTAAG